MGFESRISRLDFKPRGEQRRSRTRRRWSALAVMLTLSGTAAMVMLGEDPPGAEAGPVIQPDQPAALASISQRTLSLEIPALDPSVSAGDTRERTPSRPETPAPARIDPAALLPMMPAVPPPAPALPAPAATAQPAQAPDPVGHWQSVTVKPGDNLAAIFASVGLAPRDVYEVVHAGDEAKALTRIFPGDTMEINLDDSGTLLAVRYPVSETDTLLIRRGDDGFVTTTEVDPLEPRLTHASAIINSSFYMAGVKAGLSDRVIMELAHIFGWDIDFALDIRAGDAFTVVYQELYRDGEKIRDGEIMTVEFVNQGERFRAVRYTDPDGDAAYYTPDGRSMRKAFLRTPVNFAYVSSDFNPNRLHPVLGYKRPHMGTDYAAKTGTPIKAAGDGRIVHRGRKGGYGNTIIIRHGSRYSTLYAHMSRFRKGLSVGDHVKQGQIIGYVGSTGLATGPHLHYEFRVNGEHRNPRTVALPDAAPIPKALRADFEAQTAPRLAQLKTITGTMLAQRPDSSADDPEN